MKIRGGIVGLIIAWLSCSWAYAGPLPLVEGRFIRAGTVISPELALEVAATRQSRMIGLMYRTRLDENAGMLFLYPEEAQRHFWMKNTFISLDLIFLDSKARVQGVVERAEPRSLQHMGLDGEESQMIVELAAGSASRFGLRKGDRLAFVGKLPQPESGP